MTLWLELCKTKVSVPYLINWAELSSLSPADGSSLPINYPVHFFFFFPPVMLSFQQPHSSPPFVTFIAALSETQSCRHLINPAVLLCLFATCCSPGADSSRIQDLHQETLAFSIVSLFPIHLLRAHCQTKIAPGVSSSNMGIKQTQRSLLDTKITPNLEIFFPPS